MTVTLDIDKLVKALRIEVKPEEEKQVMFVIEAEGASD